MGLMLSILVTCVGVIELLTFFHRIRQNVVAASAHAITPNDRDNLREGYIKDLYSLRNRIYNELQAAKENCLDSSEDEAVAMAVTEKRCAANRRPQKANAAVASTSSSTPTVKNRRSPAVPVLRLASHEEIELQFTNAEDRKKIRSRSPSPRRFLLTENETSHVHHLPNRKFLVTENSFCNNCLKKSKSQNDLPEFFVEEKVVHNATRYVLKDENKTVVAPCSLPKQFYLTECGLGQIEKGQLELSEKQLELTSEDFQSPKPEFAKQLEIDNELEPEKLQFRRSPSPYPALEISAPRNSICTELLENSIGIVKEEVEESYSRSHSPSPMPSFSKYDEFKNKSDIALEQNSFSNPDYRISNQMMTVPQFNQGKSRSPSPKPKVTNLGESEDDFQVDANSNYLNDLDGLKGKKLKRNRRSIKKRKSGSEDDINASPPPTTNENNHENLAEAAKKLDKNSDREENKNPEPFWVRK